MTKPMTEDTLNRHPEEVDMEGLTELLSSLPDNMMLEVLMDVGLIDTGEADG